MKQTFPLLFLFLFLFTNCSKFDDLFKSSNSAEQKRNLTNLTDIQYGSNKDTSGKTVSLTLDLYFPSGANTANKYPLILMLHGGSYLNGDKSDMASYSTVIADSGFIVASINYRLGWRVGNGECTGDTTSLLQAGYRALQDANASLRFLMTNANIYGIDTSWVFIGGSSAGSSLALNTSYITNDVAMFSAPSEYALLGSINNADNDLTTSFKIKGICNMWGALPDSGLITASTATPTISFQGTDDNVVPYNIGYNESCTNSLKLFGSAVIQRRLEYYNTPAISNLVIGGGHGPAVYTPEFLMDNTACFFRRLITGTPITSKIYTTLVSSCD
jgi:poly(3-hydroxybutyrate) depolymerase